MGGCEGPKYDDRRIRKKTKSLQDMLRGETSFSRSVCMQFNSCMWRLGLDPINSVEFPYFSSAAPGLQRNIFRVQRHVQPHAH
jgi:hypothetical protein